MDLNDVELMESLPTGIIIDANIKHLDRYGYHFALSGFDFETCVTFPCAKEVVRFSPIKLVITEKQFVGGTIADIIELSRTSSKFFKVALLVDKKGHLTDEILNKVGIAGILTKEEPFEMMLKRVRNILSLK